MYRSRKLSGQRDIPVIRVRLPVIGEKSPQTENNSLAIIPALLIKGMFEFHRLFPLHTGACGISRSAAAIINHPMNST